MNIDVDDQTSSESPGELFRENWLDGLPVSQWPSYIDENAQLLADGIFIGETELSTADFDTETGPFYRRGLAKSVDIDPDSTSLPLGRRSAEDIGLIAWVFNRLREDIRQSETTDFQNPSRAIEAAINKVLVESIEEGKIAPDNLETIRLPESATVSTLVSEVFCRPRSEQYIDLLLEAVQKYHSRNLIELLDEPRMVTSLWNHQREALSHWFDNDYRGYVDMATATGKTVLGLAAIAHHFGELHPNDRELAETGFSPDQSGDASVLVVAHRGLILDQWKREFDTHLNIPEKSTTQSGEHTVEFEWGEIRFWTPNRLQEQGVPNTDLVILDETHHYLGSSGFGSILDDIDGHLLALSGSLDDANARTLERRDIPKIFEFSLQDGQEAGIIPQCDWDVVFTPYEEQSELAEVTQQCRKGIEQFSDGIQVPDSADVDTDEVTFTTLSEARSLAQSTVGRELKGTNVEFREFASAVMARQLTQYNLSPALSTVVRLVLDRIDQNKCVVLLETGDEIDLVTEELRSQLGEGYDSLVTVLDGDGDLEAIEKFDHEQEHGAIIGVAQTLGEGVDIETADVCINRGRGRLSRSLVQRMGRILRNPDGQKHAHFFHISGVQTQEEAQLIQEDGVTLLETASQLLSWGQNFDARPVFELDTRTSMTENDLVELETAGAEAIDAWTPEHYEWPSDEGVKQHIKEICGKISGSDDSALLAIERPEREDVGEPDDELEQARPEQAADAVPFVAADGGGVLVRDYLYAMCREARGDGQSVAEFISQSVRQYTQETLSSPPSDLAPTAEGVEVELNPALDALLTAYTDPGAKPAAVNVALAKAVSENADSLIQQAGLADQEGTISDYLSSTDEVSTDE